MRNCSCPDFRDNLAELALQNEIIIQTWLCFFRKKIQRRVLKKNPLKNLRVMIKLNPYAKTMRRNTILRHAQNVSAAGPAGAGAPAAAGVALTDHLSLFQHKLKEEKKAKAQAKLADPAAPKAEPAAKKAKAAKPAAKAKAEA